MGSSLQLLVFDTHFAASTNRSYYCVDSSKNASLSSTHPLSRSHQTSNKRNHQSAPKTRNILRHKPNRSSHLARNTDRQLGVLVRLFIRPSASHKIVVHVRTLHPIQHIQEEHTGLQILILERSNLCRLATLGHHPICPGHHVGVADIALAHALRERGERVCDIPPHQLPDHAEREGALAIRDICALDADERETVLLSDLDGVVRVLHCFEARHTGPDGQVRLVRILRGGCDGVGGRFVDVAPVDAAGDDFVVGLQQYRAILEVIKEGYDGWLDIEAVEPESEYPSFTLALRVEVFDFGFLFFRDGVQAGVVIEEIGDKGEVEFRIPCYKRGGCEELAARWVEAVGILQDLLGSLVKVRSLEWAA